jgi:hypothetical protein
MAQTYRSALEEGPVIELLQGSCPGEIGAGLLGSLFRFSCMGEQIVLKPNCPVNKLSLNGAIKHSANKLVKTFFMSTQYFFADVTFLSIC